MKKILAIIITALMMFSTLATVHAYELPHSFWEPADRYAKALETKNKEELIRAGRDILAVLENEPKNPQVTEIIASKLYDMGEAYEALGGARNHILAGECFEAYIPYGEQNGWTDGVKIAKEKSIQFKPDLRLYTPTTESQCYYGAVNEPEMGVLYGQTSERYQDNESMILLYIEYGDTGGFDWANVILRDARSKGKAVELALNFPQQGNQLYSIIYDTDFLNRLMSLLAGYPDVPIFLRIGAEFNIWPVKADPGLFIEAFRKIASTAKRQSNIATVWSVSHTSEWSIDIRDFYPGDSYVDWVGISAYADRHFGGQLWSPEESYVPIMYKAADAADPVLMLREIIELYGDRKPIMLAECGTAYYTRGEINDYSTGWAVTALKRMYTMVPIVYPQVKLIAYFNKNIPNETDCYDLDGCYELKAAYNEVTKSPWFIQKSFDNKTAMAFKEIKDTVSATSSLTLYAYPHLYGDDVPTVNYYIDGTWVAGSNALPYEKNLNLSGFSAGTHTLTAEIVTDGLEMYKKDCILQIGEIASTPENELDGLTSYQHESLDFCLEAGVISGYDDGTIKPNNTITRAEFATMTARFFSLPMNQEAGFDDTKGHWASKYIAACVEAGAINGMGDNKFAPNDKVSYEQAMTILTRMCGYTKNVDIDALGGYPQAYMTIGNQHGLSEGLSEKGLLPSISRINIAVLFYNTQN